jgi:hypothetical protein
MPNHVTDTQLATLRACLDETAASGNPRDQIDSWELDGFGYLVYAAVVIVVQRRFGPTWTTADVVRYVGNVRSHGPDSDDIDPLAAESLIRQALGDDIRPGNADASTRAILLSCLVADEDLDSSGLDDLLVRARMLADEWLDKRT